MTRAGWGSKTTSRIGEALFDEFETDVGEAETILIKAKTIFSATKTKVSTTKTKVPGNMTLFSAADPAFRAPVKHCSAARTETIPLRAADAGKTSPQKDTYPNIRGSHP
jgi:hypothetical protein